MMGVYLLFYFKARISVECPPILVGWALCYYLQKERSVTFGVYLLNLFCVEVSVIVCA